MTEVSKIIVNFAYGIPYKRPRHEKGQIGLCSIQEYNQFKIRIFDAIDEWQDYYDCKPAHSLLVDPTSLQVCIGERHGDGDEWYAFDIFFEDGEASTDAILDFADKFCFVR